MLSNSKLVLGWASFYYAFKEDYLAKFSNPQIQDESLEPLLCESPFYESGNTGNFEMLRNGVWTRSSEQPSALHFAGCARSFWARTLRESTSFSINRGAAEVHCQKSTAIACRND